MLALYYNGIRHMFRVSERFGFLSALSEEMHRCAIVLDKTKLVDSLPSSDFDLIDPPYYSFTITDVLVNSTLLDSFDVPSFSISLVELQCSSLQGDNDVLSSVSSSTSVASSSVLSHEISSVSPVELPVELPVMSSSVSPAASPIASPSILHQTVQNSLPHETHQGLPSALYSYNHSLVINSTMIGEMMHRDPEKFMIRQIPFSSLFLLVADLINHQITLQYEYQSKLCTCCYCCDQVRFFICIHH